MSGKGPELHPEGDFSGVRIGIVASLWHSDLVDRMVDDGIRTLQEHGVMSPDNILLARVPGAFELPFASASLLEADEVDAVITYGVVIRGETPHFEFVARACADGVMRLGLDSGRPVVFGVLTTDNIEQASERCQSKGIEAARVALEMLQHRF